MANNSNLPTDAHPEGFDPNSSEPVQESLEPAVVAVESEDALIATDIGCVESPSDTPIAPVDTTPEGARAPATGDQPRADREEVFRLVLEFKERHQLKIRFDDTYHLESGPLMATQPAEIGPVLRREDIDERWILDEFLMEMKAVGLKLRKSDAERAVRKALTRAKLRRRRQVLEMLLKPLSPQERLVADQAWARLTSIFEGDSDLCKAILAHHVWQVKTKQLNRQVRHHLMAIVVSRVQGSGKTTFARAFHGPLEELATGPVLLTDFADPRNKDLYRYPAILIDDVGEIPANMVATLKALVTADQFRRRVLGTSMSSGVRQRSTLFGTANNPIEALIPDSSGHRRFASLPFRNGAVEKGGDPEIWKIVSETDYCLLWRSVDVFGPSPIEDHLDALFKHQGAGAPASPILSWLSRIDIAAEDVMRIRTREGVGANELYDKYLRDTGSDISQTRFGLEVKRHLRNPAVPFEAFVRTARGRFYSVKKFPTDLKQGLQ